MRIAILQLNPIRGEVEQNIHRADAIIQNLKVDELDILVLPEMAFTGYNFTTKVAVAPYLEVCGSGVTSTWAMKTARRLKCHVIVGYPESIEKEDTYHSPSTYTTINSRNASKHNNFNSALIVSPEGLIIHNYRKCFLFESDKIWADEGFPSSLTHTQNVIKTPGWIGILPSPLDCTFGIGICMDLNPYEFEPHRYDDYEFTNHMVEGGAQLIIIPMAWLSLTKHYDPLYDQIPCLQYWKSRLAPLTLKPDKKYIIVLANRCGVEEILNIDDDGEKCQNEQREEGEHSSKQVLFAGTSCVLFAHAGIIVELHGSDKEGVNRQFLSRDDEELLIVDAAFK